VTEREGFDHPCAWLNGLGKKQSMGTPGSPGAKKWAYGTVDTQAH
jgi:hypothetical protein